MSDQAFTCAMCGQCCQGIGGIVVTLKEQVRLAQYLGLELDRFLDQHTHERDGKRHVNTGPDKYCVFFLQDKGCGVHPAKPDVCRAWPFFRGNLLDEISLAMAKEYCPGINPSTNHSEFLRQGMIYLTSRGLITAVAPNQPNALVLSDLVAALKKSLGKNDQGKS